MSAVKYTARAGGFLNNKQAKILGKFIEKHFPDGALTPSELLEAARPKKSEIHSLFDWDDTQAAEKYRLFQARNIIRCVVVEFKEKHVSAFHRVYVEAEKKFEYVDLHVAQKSEDLWAQVVQKALAEAKSWSDRYETYRELEPIRQSIAETERKLYHVKAKQKRKERPTVRSNNR